MSPHYSPDDGKNSSRPELESANWPERMRGILRLLCQMPPAISGSGGHNATYKVACRLAARDLTAAEKWTVLRGWNARRAHPPWSDAELRHKLDDATQATRSSGGTPTDAPGKKSRPSMKMIAPIALDGRTVSDLPKLSPLELTDQMDADFFLDRLHLGNPLLCVGSSPKHFATDEREVMRGHLSEIPLIVPNPMRAFEGTTKSGKTSERSLDNTGEREYLVIEFDFSDSEFADLKEQLAAKNRSTQDACAALLLHLAGFAPLAMVVDSAGKSLHGWFLTKGKPESELLPFMNYAAALGADTATFSKCQMVRLPGGLRLPERRRQSVLFFRPAPACPISSNQTLASEWMPLPPLEDRQDFPEPGYPESDAYDCYYEHPARKYWWRNGDRYISGGLGQVCRYLNRLGIASSRPNDGGPSMVDIALQKIESEGVVDLAIALAGKKAGRHECNGKVLLCTHSTRLVEPMPGEWPIIKSIVDGLLKIPEQIDAFLGWAHITLEALHAGRPRRGQALILAGPRDCGKTLLLEIITRTFGGESAEPYSFLLGNTEFNAEMFSCVHQVLDDEACSGDPRKTKLLGAGIKKLVAASKQKYHGKGQTALRVPVTWRVGMAVNDDPEALRVLPALDDGNRDKFMILKCQAFPMPVDTGTPDGEERLSEAIDRELPAFVHFLLHYKIPKHLVGGRYRIKHYHNPEILELIEAESPADQLLDFINTDVFEASSFRRCRPEEWKGTTQMLESLLGYKDPARAKALFWTRNVCGMLLAQLARRPNSQVSRGTEIRGLRQWIIRPPEEPPCIEPTGEPPLAPTPPVTPSHETANETDEISRETLKHLHFL